MLCEMQDFLPSDFLSISAPSEDGSVMKLVTQELPEKLIVISRPRKERFVMAPEGGTIQSACVPDVKVLFPPHTLNTSTKVVLQVTKLDLVRDTMRFDDHLNTTGDIFKE